MSTNVNTTTSTSTSSSSTSTSGGNMSNRVPLTIRDFFFQDPFFQSNWTDFDRLRQDMIRDSRDFWTRADPAAATLDASAPAASAGALSPMVFPRPWMFSRQLSEQDKAAGAAGAGAADLFPVDFFAGKQDQQVIRLKDDDSKFELSLDTHDYRPDEIKVNVLGQTLSVEAKHEEKSDGHSVSRQFSRKYTLPQGCEANKVHSNLSSDGILMITAPKKQAIKQDDGSRPVPIERK